MLTRDDIEEIAGALPETTIERSPDGRPAFRVRGKVYARQRDQRPDAVDHGTGERLDDVMMFRVADEGVKQALLADPSGVWFTTPHFDGWPAILLRIADLGRLSRERDRGGDRRRLAVPGAQARRQVLARRARLVGVTVSR